MITIKNAEELQKMREAGRIVAEVFELMREKIAPGITTAELNMAAERLIAKRHAKPLFKGYNGFPAALCVSVNDEVIHGIPGPRKLKEGDIVSIDVGAQIHGYCGDAARTFPVGEVKPEVAELLRVTEASLYAGIEMAVAGNRLGDIGNRIQTVAEAHGLGVVVDYVGHGIGRNLHEAPDVPNYGRPGRGLRLVNGMTLAIEPMLNMGTPAVRTLADGWTVVTLDGLPSAHFENTVAITPDGPVLLTVL
ncbi:MAG: type I methionyl aminopeptidase [Firmicutes bacterium]|nr:type I methionyl aminopeptidase [Bacillota bacterium]MBQ3200216.1 type I methionyl aminopeptidase [Bacillota bacterium]